MNRTIRLYLCALTPLWTLGFACNEPPVINILSPAHGSFSTASNVTISGNIGFVNVADARVLVNGTQAAMNPDGTWSINLPLNATPLLNPYFAELRRLSDNATLARTRILVIYGQSVADGDFSLDSVALRINDSGLNTLEPLIASGVTINPATLLPVGTVVISNYCAIPGPFGTCLGRETATIANPPASITGFAIDTDSMTNFVTGDVDISNLKIQLNLSGSGLAPSCGLRLTANNTQILGDYALQPDSADRSKVDVNEVGNPVVSFTGFTQTFTSGLCNFPLIGSLIQLIIGSVEPTVVNGFENYLKDPDGAGPLDAPVADAIEVALSNISIAGPIGDTLLVNFEAPLFDVAEDTVGVTLGSDARITSSIGSGPGQCQPPAGSPNLAASYHVSEPFPSFAATTPPPSSLPYDIGVAISTSAFNQLLKAQIECGLLRTSLTQIDLGTGPTPVTAGTLGLFISSLRIFNPATPMRIDLEPTLAPFLTGNPGPSGQIAELWIPQLVMELHFDGFDGDFGLVIRGAIDARAGLGLTFDDVTSSLAFTVSDVSDLKIAFLTNTINTGEAALASVLNTLLPSVLPSLGAGLGTFPLPQFFGLNLQGVEVSRSGQFLTLFANLVPGP